jgi:uncharacterized protein (UPF0305 family)
VALLVLLAQKKREANKYLRERERETYCESGFPFLENENKKLRRERTQAKSAKWKREQLVYIYKGKE